MNATHSTFDDDLAALYAGPFADFIRARDALAKQLRAAGRKDEAATVKSLRKPSRPAWALNRVAHHRAETLNRLDDAVAELVDAHAGSGDVRSSMTILREAVRACATHAVEEAQSEGLRLDVGDLSNAVLAVLASRNSYEELRNGRLTDIPEAGGLDFLTSLPARPRLEVSRPTAPPQADPAESEEARKQAHATSQALERARVAAEAAAVALTQAESDVASAEVNLRAAQAGVKEALQRRAFARKAKESTTAELRAAEAADETAQRRLRSLSRS